jgi:acyl-CoA thioesterase FadM
MVQVPVVSVNTNLLTSLHPGDLVEIDTQTGVYIGEELVLRVRVRKLQT